MPRTISMLTCWLAAAALFAAAAPARADWPPGGVPVSQDSEDQSFSVLATDGAGGAIVVWQEFGRIFAQHLTAEGDVAPSWPADHGLEVCPDGPDGPYTQSSQRAAPDGAGGAFVLWHDGRNSGCLSYCFDELRELYLERLTREGTIAPGWPRAGLAVGSSRWTMAFTAGSRSPRPSDFNTVMISDGAGGVLIAWLEGPPYSGDPVLSVRAQRVSGAGSLLWGPRGVRLCAAAGDRAYPAIAADGDGGAFVVWEDARAGAGARRLYGQHVSAEGRALWPRDGIRVTTGAAPDERAHVIAADDHGGAFLAWQAGGVPESTLVYAGHLTRMGTLAWNGCAAVAAARGPQSAPSIAPDGSGGAWVAWIDERTGASQDVYAQRLNRGGRITRGWPVDGLGVCAAPLASRSSPVVADDGTGGAYVGWFDGRFYPRATRIMGWGVLASTWPAGGVHLSDSDLGDYQLKMVSTEKAGAIVAWSEGRPPTGGTSRVLVQHLTPGGAAAPPPERLGRYDPLPIASLAPARLALRGFLPNPAFGSPALGFTLPDGGPAKLEVFDLAGRRCATLEVGSLGAGAHVLAPGALGTLPTGTYLVRLTRGERAVTARGTIVR